MRQKSGPLGPALLRRRECVSEALVRVSLLNYQWHLDQHFVYKIDRHDGILCGFQGLDYREMENRDALMVRARSWMEQMKSLLDKRVFFPNFLLSVCYFERITAGVTPNIMHTGEILQGKLGSFKCEDILSNLHVHSDIFHRQMDKLRQFPLKWGQYFLHFYVGGKKCDPSKSSTLCLVQIVDKWVMFHGFRKKSRTAFDLLSRYIIPGSPYKSIVIKYHERHFPEAYEEYLYHLDTLH